MLFFGSEKMERETGFEPATPSLEGSRSSQLSYSRLGELFIFSHDKMWRGEDSNLRRHTPADLQSAPFGHSGTSPYRPLSDIILTKSWR